MSENIEALYHSSIRIDRTKLSINKIITNSNLYKKLY
mgnify:CR=1 FL=1